MSINGQAAELEDFTTVNGVFQYTTNTSWGYRSGYQRGTLYQYSGGASAELYKALGFAKTTQCIGVRCGDGTQWAGASVRLLAFADGAQPLLAVFTTITTGELKLCRWNGSSWDTLDTGAAPAASPFRLDMYVENYGASGRVRVWLQYTLGYAPAQLWLDSGTMDITTPGSTDFDGFYFVPRKPAEGNGSFSEVVFADEPTMRLNLATIYPNAAGDTNTWDSGTYASVDEMAADTGDFTESGTAGQLLLANVTDLPATAETPQNVQVTVLAAKGTTGPTKIALAIKTHGTVYYSGEFSLTEAYAAYSYIWNVNPNTSAAWTRAEITALQIGYESRA